MKTSHHLKVTGHSPEELPLPARLNVEQAARLLGFQPHDIPILMGHRILKPLGTPADNAPKYFAAVLVLNLATDIAWLERATRTITHHWKTKNLQKKKGQAPCPSTFRDGV